MLHGSRERSDTLPSHALYGTAFRWGWLFGVLAWLALGAPCDGSNAGAYVLSATFNGASSAAVAPGAEVKVAVTVQLVGSEGTDSWWCSTRYEFSCPETQVISGGCVSEPSPAGGCYCNWGCRAESTAWEGTFSTTFTVKAPSVAGTYDVTLCALNQEGACDVATCSSRRTFADAVNVTCGAAHTPLVAIGGSRLLTCAVPSATLTATVSSGTSPYAYLWTPGNWTSQSIAVTAAGTYTVKVTGANGCYATACAVVTEDKAAPSVEAGDSRMLTCAVLSVTQTASATGGTPPYAYLWTPGNWTTQAVTLTSPGTYAVKVTDANGCSASDSVAIIEDKAAPSVEAGLPQVLTCAVPFVTQTASATGGVPPYTYAWSPSNVMSQSITATAPDIYTVRVTGANGCTASDSVVISAPVSWAERLANGGFEKGLDGWQLYPSSSPGESTASTFAAVAPYFPPASETSCPQSGTAYLQGHAADLGSTVWIVQDVTALLQPGHLYRLSGWIWRDATDSIGPVISLHYVMGDGSTPPGGAAVELRLPADRDPSQWTYCASSPFVHMMPAGCTQVWLMLGLVNCTGYAWWDDVSLMEYSPP
jgi:hypothetical protein